MIIYYKKMNITIMVRKIRGKDLSKILMEETINFIHYFNIQ